MIKNSKLLEKFEDNLKKIEKIPYKDSLKIFQSLWNEAKTLKILPCWDSMEGIEVKIRIARILNSCSKNF